MFITQISLVKTRIKRYLAANLVSRYKNKIIKQQSKLTSQISLVVKLDIFKQ
jgi:hypothetical protein